MSERHVQRRGHSGFTLLEMLLVLTLFSVLSILLAQTLASGQQGWQKLLSDSDTTGTERIGMSFMREAIRLARPSPGGAEDDAFRGQTDRLRWLAESPARLGAGLWRYELFVEQDKLRLRMTSRDGEIQEVRDLIRGVRRLRLAFWTGTRWLQVWRESSRVPDLVRVRVLRDDGKEQGVMIALLGATKRLGGAS